MAPFFVFKMQVHHYLIVHIHFVRLFSSIVFTTIPNQCTNSTYVSCVKPTVPALTYRCQGSIKDKLFGGKLQYYSARVAVWDMPVVIYVCGILDVYKTHAVQVAIRRCRYVQYICGIEEVFN